jgi:hypothetical protein
MEGSLLMLLVLNAAGNARGVMVPSRALRGDGPGRPRRDT